MSRRAFSDILNLLKEDPVFHNESNVPQADVATQLMVAFYRFGMFGNDASVGQVADKFG
ncbi:hypothetical protein DFQ28_009064, partial [Apophysomyces sp. BC1034]